MRKPIILKAAIEPNTDPAIIPPWAGDIPPGVLEDVAVALLGFADVVLEESEFTSEDVVFGSRDRVVVDMLVLVTVTVLKTVDVPVVVAVVVPSVPPTSA